MIRVSQIGLTFADGDEWEAFCQSCLKIKHQSNNFKSVPADEGNGDYGLDGFNSIGDVYQCYCPEKEYTDKELYFHQRKKVTEDIQKLYNYKDKIKKILNGCKIKVWHFTSPVIKSKELIVHCNEKENLVRSWKLDFIDGDFKIGLKDCEYFLPEIPYVISAYKSIDPTNSQSIDFLSAEPHSKTIDEYKSDYSNSEFVNNGIKKNRKLFPSNTEKDYTRNIIELTDSDIGNSIVGESILRNWSSSYDRQYEKFIRIRRTLERRFKSESLIPVSNNSEKLREIKSIVKATLDKEFPLFLSESNKEELTAYLVSYWLLQCTLDFS